jgi:hypothetical protein
MTNFMCGRDVPNLDTDGPSSTCLGSDPICGVFSDGKEVGRTEFLKDAANPVFKNTIDFTYTPDANQQLTFSLYDLDFIGADRQVPRPPKLFASTLPQ